LYIKAIDTVLKEQSAKKLDAMWVKKLAAELPHTYNALLDYFVKVKKRNEDETRAANTNEESIEIEKDASKYSTITRSDFESTYAKFFPVDDQGKATCESIRSDAPVEEIRHRSGRGVGASDSASDSDSDSDDDIVSDSDDGKDEAVDETSLSSGSVSDSVFSCNGASDSDSDSDSWYH
jgi:hypothetical protein